MNGPSNSVPDENNLFLALLGFNAPLGRSLVEQGNAIVLADQKLGARFFPAAPKDEDREAIPDQAKVRGDISWCKPSQPGFWEMARSGQASQSLMTDNAELERRYATLVQYTGYFDTRIGHEHYSESVASPSHDMRCLFLTRVVQGLSSDVALDQGKAARDLVGDIGVWRIVLAGSSNTVSKSIAGAFLSQDYSVLGLALANSPNAVTWFVPFDYDKKLWLEESEWKWGRTSGNEARRFCAVLRAIPEARGVAWNGAPWIADRLFGHFDKPNASANLVWQIDARFREIANGDPRRIPSQTKELQEWVASHTSSRLSMSLGTSFRFFYNPIGKALISDHDIGAEMEYPLRMYDRQATERLARISFELRRNHVARQDAEKFIYQHPEWWSTHAVTGRSFDFNSKTGELSFVPASERYEDRGVTKIPL